MRSITVSCPAKVNLYLRVLKKRPDGYHDLCTLFHRISLADSLTLHKQAQGFNLTCDRKGLPVDERNLVTRAYFLLKERCPGLGGIRAVLRKKIPLGAGLGGGSSDAASFLLAANRLYGLRLSRKALVAIGKKLGADVPFFLYDTPQAVAWGRGDVIHPEPVPGRFYMLLILSNKGVSTKEVFCSRKLKPGRVTLTKASREVKMLSHFFRRKSYQKIADFLQNDLEIPAFDLRPEIGRKIKALKKSGYSLARMSGSGPTVFILFSSLKELNHHRVRVRRLFPSACLQAAHTL